MIYPLNAIQHRIDAFMEANPQLSGEPFDPQRACDISNFLRTKSRRRRLKHPSHTAPRSEQLLALLKILPGPPIPVESTNLDLILGLHIADFKLCTCRQICRGRMSKATNLQVAEIVRLFWDQPFRDRNMALKQQTV
jgi:hypothetical protein